MADANDDNHDTDRLRRRVAELEQRLDEANRLFSLLTAPPRPDDPVSGLGRLPSSILEALHETVAVIFDRDGNYLATWSDPKLEQRYGLKARDIVGRNLRDFFPPEEAEKYLGRIRLIFDEKAAQRTENPVYMPNGVFWHDSVASPLRDESGRVVGVLLMAQDITRSKRAEKNLAESEERYRVVAEQSSDFIVLHRQGQVLYANPAAARAAGYDSGEDMRGMPVLELVHPDSRELVKKRMAQAARANKPLPPIEEYFVGREGQLFIGEAVSQQVTLGGKEAVLTVVRNITARRRLEEERARLRERYTLARKHESLSLMAMGMAHDFNNLLMGILGNASMLVTDLPQDSPEYELARRIEKASSLAADITRQLVEFAGQGRSHAQAIDVAQQVDDTMHMLAGQLPESIHLQVNVQRGLPAVRIGRAHLTQMLLNLVHNAVEATVPASGLITVSVTACPISEAQLEKVFHDHDLVSDHVVCIEIRDEGRGMDEHVRERVFDPFFSTKEGGRGLGLAGVLGIVMRYGGAIKVESNPGRGSTFQIWLPGEDASADSQQCSRPEEEPADTAEPEQSGDPHGPGNGTSNRVLVVEDEQIVREVLVQALEEAGFRTVPAADGRQALDIFEIEPHRFALALLDMNMPGLNGLQVLNGLRQVRPQLPVILSSGQAPRLPPDDIIGPTPIFLAKPYRPQKLLELVQRLVPARE